MLGSPLFFGFALFSLIGSKLADWYGRKPITICSYLGVLLFTTGLLLSENIDLTSGLMFALGTTIPGIIAVSYVYTSELLSLEQQYTFDRLWVFFDGFANIIAVLGYMFITNNYYFIVSAQASLALIATLLLLGVPESPLWLNRVNRNDDAKANFKVIMEQHAVQDHTELLEAVEGEKEQEAQQPSITNLLQHPDHSVNFFVMMYSFCAELFSFALIQFYIKYLPGELFTNALSMFVAGLLGAFASVVGLKKFGPVFQLSFNFGLAVVAGALIYAFGFTYIEWMPVFIFMTQFAL